MLDRNVALVEQTRAFAQLVAGRDMTVRVPTTPAWSLAELVTHVGHGHQWSSQIVARRAQEQTPEDYLNAPGATPADHSAATLLQWLPGTAQAFVDAITEQGSETMVWTFLGPRPARWWLRRRLHESTVHRADAALALGLDYELSPELAADGISEYLGLVSDQAGQEIPTVNGMYLFPAPLNEGKALHLAATDTDAEWTLVRNGDGVSLSAEHDRSVTVVRGPATDLLLVLTRRRPVSATGSEVTGDPAVLPEFLERTPYTG